MKHNRTHYEQILLEMQKEFISDVKKVKKQHTAKDHRNREELKWKINIIQNLRNSLRDLRNSSYSMETIEVPLNKITLKFQEKVIRKVFAKSNFYIKISKKDFKKGRLTEKNLKRVLDYVGDTTWVDSIDYTDTIDQIKSGKSLGIAFLSYEDYNSLFKNSDLYISQNKSFNPLSFGEYVDVYKENEKHFKKNCKKTISFKKILKKSFS